MIERRGEICLIREALGLSLAVKYIYVLDDANRGRKLRVVFR
jgi:hypothetical protein